MSYFNRLTDIVTCNLAEILAQEGSPVDAVRQIIQEIEDGVTGAKRSVNSAAANEQRLDNEVNEHRTQVAYWTAQAREELSQGHDDKARFALLRKKELEDLIAALRQQQAAAVSTRQHLATTLRALEVRLSEARRTLQELLTLPAAELLEDTVPLNLNETPQNGGPAESLPVDDSRAAQVELELEALRRELNQTD